MYKGSIGCIGFFIVSVQGRDTCDLDGCICFALPILLFRFVVDGSGNEKRGEERRGAESFYMA